MRDLHQRVRERWQTRRKKSQNWQSLIIKVLLLIILIYFGRKVLKNKDIDWTWLHDKPTAEQVQPQKDTP